MFKLNTILNYQIKCAT